MRIPLAARSAQDSQFSSARLVNWYPEVYGQDANAPYALKPTPGLRSFATYSAGYVAGMLPFNDRVYMVTDNDILSFDENGTVSTVIAGYYTFSDRVALAEGGLQMMIVSGEYGFGWTCDTSGTVARINDADFPSASHVAFLDGYFIVNDRDNKGRFYISDLYNARSWNGNNYATAESMPDTLLNIIANNGELWLFGETSIEVWVNTGASFPFQRSVRLERGCAAEWSIARPDGILTWLSDDLTVRMVSGYAPVRISTHAVEKSIGAMDTVSDAFAWSYTEDGHYFYVLTFPSEDQTWVYDLTTKEWHERETVGLDQYRPNCYTRYWNKHFVGSPNSGAVYQLDPDYYYDDAQRIERECVFPEIRAELKPIQMKRLQIEFEQGVGDATIEDPQAMLSWSDNGGKTWSNEHWRGVGKLGEYGHRSIWRRLGRFRKRVYKLVVTDPVKWVVLNAFGD